MESKQVEHWIPVCLFFIGIMSTNVHARDPSIINSTKPSTKTTTNISTPASTDTAADTSQTDTIKMIQCNLCQYSNNFCSAKQTLTVCTEMINSLSSPYGPIAPRTCESYSTQEACEDAVLSFPDRVGTRKIHTGN